MSKSDLHAGRTYHNGRGDHRRIDRIDRAAGICWYTATTAIRFQTGGTPPSGQMTLKAMQLWAEGEYTQQNSDVSEPRRRE